MATILTRDAVKGRLIETGKQDKTQFVNPDTIPWTPWVMGGIDFKLLNVDGEKATLITRVQANPPLAVHEHLGATELYVIKGKICYDGLETSAGGYMYEPPGTIHEPTIPVYSEFLAIFHGPLRGFTSDGTEHLIKTQDYYELAKQNGAIAHLPK
jgi:quercetin dioxygenase-like cupin family protein